MVERKTLSAHNDWEDQQRGADISVSFANGDVFGARAGVYTERMRSARGTVEVYKNGNLVGTRDVGGWVYTANGGYIGLWTVGGNATYYDDPSFALRTSFGGGDLPISYQPGGSKVLAAYHPAPAVRVKAAPRQYVRPRSMLTLTQEPGVVWRSYYYAGAARIALREDSDAGTEVYFILTDHLGSTSLTYRDSDGQTAAQKYKPWGEVRQVVGELPTNYTFTGQRDAGWGLYFFQARWFDSALGRFAQADTIVPGAGNPLAWDRYAALFNNPANITDPSGHLACRSMEECEDMGKTPNGGDWDDLYFSKLNDPYAKSPSYLSISQSGLNFIKSQEGLYLQLYNDGNLPNNPFFHNLTGGGQGNCTIGYGHLVHTGPCKGDPREANFTNGITNNQADEMLRNDVLPAEQGIRKYVKVMLTQPQYDALVSLVFNWGIDNFRASPKLSLLNKGEYADMAIHLRKGPLSSNGQIYPGLVRRREAELLMFLTMVDRP